MYASKLVVSMENKMCPLLEGTIVTILRGEYTSIASSGVIMWIYLIIVLQGKMNEFHDTKVFAVFFSRVNVLFPILTFSRSSLNALE